MSLYLKPLPCNYVQLISSSLLSAGYEIEISQYDSHPIHTDLGLTSQAIKPLVSFYANLDFNIGNGSVLAQTT